MLPDVFTMAVYFARTRWLHNFRDRRRLEAWQQDRLLQFFSSVLPRAPRYRDLVPSSLADLPVMDKAAMMGDFLAYNTRGVALDDALPMALQAEMTRDFTPMLGDLTVGLSSGTSGSRGVFLVSKAERLRWAGVMLARALPQHLIGHLISSRQPPLRVAFFLRANSNLYMTLNSRRISFAFYDLLLGIGQAVPNLNTSQPDVLVGPPNFLRALAAEVSAGRLHIRPSHVISVAEVLEAPDAKAVREAFGVSPHQLYQAAEGFLGYTCEQGSLHLNESFIHVEPEWLDTAKTRFQPVITDFMRETQLIVRYRLNDVLRVSDRPCLCGRAERSIAAIEGRSDEILWLSARESERAVAVYPDFVRRAMLLAGPAVRDFEVIQSGTTLCIGLLADGDRAVAIQRVSVELAALWKAMNVRAPAVSYTDWQSPPVGIKRRRVRMAAAPEGLSCMF